MKPQDNFNGYMQQAVRDNWNRQALTNFNGETFMYKDVARKIAKLHILYRELGIRPGDKIALTGRNSAGWAVTFFSILTYGAVAVPILHEFKADNVHHLVNHSEAKLLFCGHSMWENLDPELMPDILGAIYISDFSLAFSRSATLNVTRSRLNELFGREYPERFTPENVNYYCDSADELCLINYTSGSTGFSKGVMLTYRVMWSNLQYIFDKLNILRAGDGHVCMLPMAHMYGMMVDLVYGFAQGCHLHFLTRTPSPRVIVEAFAKVRPRLVVAVPLIIEKIVKTKVFPMLEKPLMKLMMHVPYVDHRLLRRIKESLNEAFGGNMEEMIIGGAALNADIEKFLRKVGFPYTGGYGMTECGPLISYAPHAESRQGSCGRAVDRMQLRIDSPDPQRIPGVLCVKGDNVMSGYYKNMDATRQVLTDDGWMSTGDICTLDADGFLYIRGRDKNMILGPSGQNIYPEEIEQKLNNMPYVCESLVIDDGGKLVALVYPDFDNARMQGISLEQLNGIMEENIRQLNPELPAYSKVSGVRVYHEEFEKTPKHSIKRYLYTH